MKKKTSEAEFKSSLPPLYAKWVGSLLQGDIPEEELATCNDCAMCVKGHGNQTIFDSSIKCCSYVPKIPNYLAGRILADKDPQAAKGRATFVERMKKGVGLTPLGVDLSPSEQVLYQHITQNSGFGKKSEIRCPHYLDQDGGQCGIYKHRNAVCVTFFCKHVRGSVGKGFWNKVLRFLNGLENDLSLWCVLRLDPGESALKSLADFEEIARKDPEKAGRINGVIDASIAKQIWGKWHGKEEQFFMECSRLIEPMDWKEVIRICGPSAESAASLTKQAYKDLLAEQIPERLKVGSFQVSYVGPEFTAVSTYSPLDPISLPRPLVEVLHYFDGRKVKDAVKIIDKEANIELDLGLVQKLIDYQVLVSATEQVKHSDVK